jgi:Na+/proline symporter
MVVIVVALVAMVITLLVRIPVDPDSALRIAGAAGRLQVFDFSFDLTKTYTFWSGIIGGTFLMLSYFGTDQSQVQRYLTARTVDEARSSQLISAYWKIPLQALILLVGVLVFVYYLFVPQPLLWNPAHARAVQAAEPARFDALSQQFWRAMADRESSARALGATARGQDAAAKVAFRTADAQVQALRTEALAEAKKVTGENPRDVNYIIPRFVVNELPIGLAGLFIAAVIAAAMSAVAGELSSLSTATVIDFYRRWYKPEASDAHYLFVSRAATGVWGLIACGVAIFAARLGSLIEVVNRFGSFFYGSILGVFILAMIPRARSLGAFIGLFAGMTAVGLVSWLVPSVSFLWHNVIGAVTVVAVGMLLSMGGSKARWTEDAA